MNGSRFLNVNLNDYGNGKRQRLSTVDEDATCASMIQYGEMSPQKRFVRRATPIHCETAT